jgi:soluble lytic murein transglycosylase-like protein
MRRLVVLLAVFFSGAVQPVFADDLGAREQDVKQQLASASNQITQLNLQMATLQQSVADTQQRVERERVQVRLLARALYAQPDSVVALVFESASIAEAVTRIADLTSAGDRAAAVKRALDRDLARLTEQRDQLRSDRERTVALQKQLQGQFAKLVAQVVAQRLQSPAPGQTPISLDPGSVGAIQAIILDAFAPLGAAVQSWALRVAKCESNYNPYAVNRSSGAAGLFQFLPSTWAASPYHAQSVFDPVANSRAAAWLYQRSGPGQWVCSSLT